MPIVPEFIKMQTSVDHGIIKVSQNTSGLNFTVQTSHMLSYKVQITHCLKMAAIKTIISCNVGTDLFGWPRTTLHTGNTGLALREEKTCYFGDYQRKCDERSYVN